MNILITGASRGIGLATTKLFDTPDNQLFLVATSLASFKHDFQHAKLYAADLTDLQQLKQLASTISQAAGRIDVFFSNAGAYVPKKFEQYSDEDIDSLLDLLLRSHIHLTKAMLPALRKSSSPQIVFMSSMAAKSSIVGESVYAAAKSGITNFANTIRNEFGATIRVTAIHAWGVNTWDAPNPDDFIQPADVAETVRFVISRPATVMVESIDLSNPTQWRGGLAPWSPQ